MKKKLIAAALSVGMLASSAVPFAYAEEAAPSYSEKVEQIFTEVTEDDSIKILLNGGLMAFDDVAPELINDRTMLPFRKVLEDMGASVEFDDATRVAKAQKGDTVISFSVDSNLVNIDKSGAKSTMEMDVAPIIKNDRTLVPVRFMSEALGMNVGWDQEYHTVVIVDMDQYINGLETGCPNFMRLINMSTELQDKLPEKYKAATNIDMTITIPKELSGSEVSMNLKMTENDKVNGDNMDSDVVMDLSIMAAENSEVAEALKSIPFDLNSLKGVTFTLRTVDGKYYLKTNMLKVLADANKDSSIWELASTMIDENTWVEFTVEDLLKALSPDMDSSTIDSMMAMVNQKDASKSFTEIMKETYAGIENIDLTTGLTLHTTFAMYKDMDDSIKLDIKDNGSYTCSMDMGIEGITIKMNVSCDIDENGDDIGEIKAPLAALNFAQLIQAVELLK